MKKERIGKKSEGGKKVGERKEREGKKEIKKKRKKATITVVSKAKSTPDFKFPPQFES